MLQSSKKLNKSVLEGKHIWMKDKKLAKDI